MVGTWEYTDVWFKITNPTSGLVKQSDPFTVKVVFEEVLVEVCTSSSGYVAFPDPVVVMSIDLKMEIQKG